MEKQGKQESDSLSQPNVSVAVRRSIREIILERRGINQSRHCPMDIQVLEDPYKKTADVKGVFRKKTGYCYIPSIAHHSPWDPNFPECPQRSVHVNESMLPLYHRLKKISESRLVEISDNEMLLLAHTDGHIMNVREMCEESIEDIAQLYDSIFFNGEDSYFGAVEAAKYSLSMAKLIADGTFQNGFANVRPPGHHATSNNPNGYCFFNNVAIAANYLLRESLAERILIVDFDVHHGQGTQREFYNSKRVLYFSIHRYENGTFWPNLEESNFNFVGEGNGAGYNINVPLNNIGLRDFDYLAIVMNVLLPVAYEYNPDFIMISSGFDSCMGDDKGRMNVTPGFYAHLITMLSGLAGGKILAVLEGGYFIPSLGEAAHKTVQALLNDPSPHVECSKYIDRSVIDSINDVKVALRPYWKCFNQIDAIADVQDMLKYDRYNQHVAVSRYIGQVPKAPFPTRGVYEANTKREMRVFEAKVMELQEKYSSRATTVGYMVNPESASHFPRPDQRAQEVPRRLSHMMAKLQEYDLLIGMQAVEYDAYEYREGVFPGIWNDVSEIIGAIHSKQYLDELKTGGLQEKPDLYICEQSKMVCQSSCCVLCQLVVELGRETISHGVGIVRPPGHHAHEDNGSGFCLINNVVVAANFALKEVGYKRVLILDFDIHHGDGTQSLTYGRDDIMYISMHRFDGGNFFPKDASGNFMYIGEKENAGYNLNIPFENAKMGNADYLYTWMRVVMPVAYSFNPNLILISAGFDAGINDPLGNYDVHPEVFGHLVQLIKPVAPVLLALEGGYNHETTSLGMVNCIRALLGHPLPMPTLGNIKKEAVATMANTIAVMKPFWPLLEVNKTLDPIVRSGKELVQAIKDIEKIEPDDINL